MLAPVPVPAFLRALVLVWLLQDLHKVVQT
jgi:hypothetical protein